MRSRSDHKENCNTCFYLCGTAKRLRQPTARFKKFDEVINNQLSLLVISHHGHKNLRRRVTNKTAVLYLPKGTHSEHRVLSRMLLHIFKISIILQDERQTM